MDPDIRQALVDLKTDLRTGFSDQSNKIDQMVTRGEFVATVERLDSMLVILRRDFDGHEAEAPAHRTAAFNRVEAVRREVRADMDGFRVTTRWAITLSATGAGILVALLSWLLGLA